MSKVYCAVCGMATESNLAVSIGDKVVSFCGAHSLSDYQPHSTPDSKALLDLDTIIERIKNVPITSRMEYDFKYGDGSGKNAMDITKLHAIRQRAYKALKKQLVSLITTHTNNLLDDLEAQAEPVMRVRKDGQTKGDIIYATSVEALQKKREDTK